MVVEFSFLLSRSIATNQVEGQPACRSPVSPDRSAGWGAGSQQGLRGKPGTENKRGAGMRECKGERSQKRRKQRSREQRERERGNHTLDRKTSCTCLFHSVSQRGCDGVCSFLGKPACRELNHHTGRHARVVSRGCSAWASLAKPFPASSVCTCKGAGCGSVITHSQHLVFPQTCSPLP